MASQDKLVFIDIETGGLAWWPHECNGKQIPMNPIIQVAAIAVDASTLEEIELYEQKVNFMEECCNKEALAINSYSKDSALWQTEGIRPEAAIAELSNFLRDHATVSMPARKGGTFKVAQLVGHNSASFDVPYLAAWFKHFGKFFPGSYHCIDTITMATLYKSIHGAGFQNLKLETLSKWFAIEDSPTHDALFDVRATIGIYKAMIGAFRNGGRV